MSEAPLYGRPGACGWGGAGDGYFSYRSRLSLEVSKASRLGEVYVQGCLTYIKKTHPLAFSYGRGTPVRWGSAAIHGQIKRLSKWRSPNE